MDSNSNSCDLYMPKIENDSENEKDCNKRELRLNWNSENTMKLIQTLEKDCRELWDSKHPLNRERAARQAKLEYLADMFGTTSEEISRKIHNLRSQFNNELRKIKRRLSTPVGESGGGARGWEYFDALSFLRLPSGDPLDIMDAVNLELAEFQANEEEEFGAVARAKNSIPSGSPTNRRTKIRVAASAPPPLPPSAHPLMWPEEPVPRLRPSLDADECQIFGDFVASELRTLRSNESRKKLKRMIQKAILQVGEEEDVNIISG
ncbi:uncharacterized protein LOC115455869 [Manduca sexta]|uniref:MADF domain-containing protein n=1 Tax=Manduca sexta TaxID=7130 RepID=A0A922CBN7_MANSE|nr:uncharacterized protein LOC115455869 [Manduca sexta]KAG6440406.1 hypothetical protein O3G_MSEX001331 [Manduca sexta]